MANDIEIRVKVANQTPGGFAGINTSLRTLKEKAEDATTALTALHAAAGTVKVKAKFNDQVTAGVATVKTAVDNLNAAKVKIKAKLDDKTAPDIAAVKTALDGLRAESPVKLKVKFKGQVADIQAAAQAMQDLKGDAQGAGQALTRLGTKATAAATALEQLKDNAKDAGQALLALAGESTVATAALSDLRDKAAAAARALHRLDTRADGAGTRLGDLSTRSRTVRGDLDDVDDAVRRLSGNMANLRGRIGTVSTSSGQAHGAMGKLMRGALLLSPALLPIAAAAVPVAGSIAAATGALAAFGLAIAPQIVRMVEATQAQTKYTDAVRKHGAGSKEAATAENELHAALAKMSPETREATAAFGSLRDATNQWSNSLSSSTMPVFTKSFATLRSMLPGFTPLVQGAATQLERFVTIAAGGVGSGAFDAMMTRFSGFATGVLRDATDGMIHFARTFDGFSGGAFAEFMEYARANGPAVGETLRNLGSAMVHILASAGDLGVSVLGLVNAFAKLVTAIPTDFLATLLQTYATFKVFGLAAAGVTALGVALRAGVRGLVAFRAAAVVAGGGLAGLRAGFLALSAASRTTVVVAGITAVVVALSKLSNIGKEAPADVEKLTSALARLGRDGKVGGEAARVFGDDLGGLYEKVRSFTDPSTLDKVQQFLVSWTGFDSTPVKEAKKEFGAIDDALANLVKDGKADLAAAALKRLKAEYGKGGKDVSTFTKHLDDYKSAIADSAFEQQLVADSMGLFGEAAVATSAKLDAQKRSADGLRQAIQALNDAHRAGLGGMIGFEAAIDAAAKAAQENAGALSMTGGHLNLNGEKARDAATALSDLAQKTDEAASSARESGKSWSTVNGIYERGRAQFLKSAQAMGLTASEARKLASQILKVPSKKIQIKGELDDLRSKLAAAQKRLDSLRQRRRVAIGAEKRQLDAQVAAAQRRVNGIRQARLARLMAKDGTGAAVRSALAQMSRVQNKTVYINSVYTYSTIGKMRAAHGRASGGPVRGPGSGTSDDVPIMASNGEFVMRASSVQKYGEGFMQALNEGRLRVAAFARGGRVSKSERSARREAAGDLTISHFGEKAGFSMTEFRNALGKPADIKSLVSALNQWRSVIKKATHGDQERRLLRTLNEAGKSLIKHEKALAKVTHAMEKAKDKLDGLKQAAAQLKDSVKSGILGSANVTSGAGEGRVTVGGIMAKLTGAADKSGALAGALKTLKGKGVDKKILADIASAGIEGGGLETATALLGASKSEIASMNQLQKQIAKNAKDAGATTADAMYGAGIKAAEGVVKGLEKNKHRIEKAMDSIAKSLERAIKKALGVRGKAAGGVIGAAGGGPRSALTLVGEMGPELVDLPYGSRVRTHGDSRRAAAGWGGSQRPIELVVNLDGRTVARQIFNPLRGEVRDRGGLAALGT